MKEKNKFRYAEKCLYEYKRNLAALEVLREDLRVVQASTDVHAQSYQSFFSSGGDPSNPVQARLMRIESIEGKIHTLERFTKPIVKLIEDLNAPENLEGSNNKILLSILKLMYFGKNIPDDIADELKIAKRTFFKYRRELVYTAIEYLAF